MNTIRWFCTGLNLMTVVTCDAGCGSRAEQQPAPMPPPAGFSGPSVQMTVTPIAVRQMDLPVKEGTVPLAYLVETAGGVRVVDQTTSSALAQTTVPGRTIVSVDESRGVSIGGTIFTPGPLPADHRYGVYFYFGGFHPEEDMRVSTERNDPEILRPHDQMSGPSGGSPQGFSTTGPSPHQ